MPKKTTKEAAKKMASATKKRAKALMKGHRHTVVAIMQAMKNGGIALVPCRERTTGQLVTMLCLVVGGDGGTAVTPVAQMLDQDEVVERYAHLEEPYDPQSLQ